MDTHVIIIGLVILLIILIPVYYINKSNSVKKNKLASIFKNYSNYNFNITEHLNKKILAVDTQEKGFLLADLNKEKETSYFINLKQIKNCKLVLETAKNSDSTDKISFVFENKLNSGEETITFYDVNDNLLGQVSVYENHQLAKKWVVIINENL